MEEGMTTEEWLRSIVGELVQVNYSSVHWRGKQRGRLHAFDDRGVVISDPDKGWKPGEISMLIPWHSITTIIRTDLCDEE